MRRIGVCKKEHWAVRLLIIKEANSMKEEPVPGTAP